MTRHRRRDGTPLASTVSPLATQIDHLMRTGTGTRASSVCDGSDLSSGFFKLPFEVRESIYKLLLPSPSNPYLTIQNNLGASKPLQLCKQVYLEYSKLLYDDTEFMIDLNVRVSTILRNPHACGYPNLFRSSMTTSSCFIYPDYSELQVVRFEKLGLRVSLSDLSYSNGSREQTNLQRHIFSISEALQKSKHIKVVTVYLSVDSSSALLDDIDASSIPLLKAFQPITSTAQAKGFTVRFAKADESNIFAGQLAALANGKLVPRDANALSTPNLAYLTQQAIHQDNSQQGQGPPFTTYKKTPECHTCLSIFSSRQALRSHLSGNPRHKQPFRKKRYNKIFPFATVFGQRKCWTCGRNYLSRAKLDEHLDRKNHRRHGVVPRWVEDNAKWDRMWAKWEEKHGWL